MDKVSPPWASTDPLWIPPCQDNPFLNSQFNLSEFNSALDSKKPKSVPGMDGIDFDILKHLLDKFKFKFNS